MDGSRRARTIDNSAQCWRPGEYHALALVDDFGRNALLREFSKAKRALRELPEPPG